MSAPQRRQSDARRPPRLRKAERHKLLLAVGKQLFLAHGYPATTLEMIAQAAGVTEAVLQRHFASKTALLVEILQEVRQATLDRWQPEIAALTDPLARLHAIIDLYLETIREHAAEVQIMHRTLLETDDPEILSALRTYYLDCEALLAEVITAGQQAGVFRRELDARIGAWEVIHSALGHTLTWPLHIPLHEEADYWSRASDCMLQCLLKTDV